MSHVISAQPSATSPYQPTALQEGNGGDIPPRIHRIDSEQRDDCCIHTRNKKGCCLFVCTLFSICCEGIKNCTESCCDFCANCLNDCCEDKPRERTQRIYNKRYTNSAGSYYDNTADNDDWGINSLSAQHMHVGVGNNLSEPSQELLSNSNENDYSRGPDLATHHTSPHRDSFTHHSSNHHDSGNHHSSNHNDSGTHHSSSHHDSGTHHTSSHDTSTYHTSSHDTGGGGDSGGGDTGGGCDSGGGGGDSGGGDTGGGCDSGGGGGDDD